MIYLITEEDNMFYQVWLLNCGQVQTMLGQFTDIMLACQCIEENANKYLPLDLELSVTATYHPYPEHC